MAEHALETDSSNDKAYTIALFSIHGLIRGESLELGRDADTGGQTKYLVELASALGKHPQVARVDLFTRLIEDERVSQDYAQRLEPLNERARIVRIPCGPSGYHRKELLWPYLDAFIEGSLEFLNSEATMPDWLHGHYADAGYVALELAKRLKLPFIFTGHSLGRNKLQVLQQAGLTTEAIEEQYNIQQRIRVEESCLEGADLVIASTQHEVERGYEFYNAHKRAQYRVIPPGINVDTFYPYYHDSEEQNETDEAQLQATVKMRGEIGRFLNNPNKPLILAVSRPDRRKNIGALVTAYGEDKELQSIANLAIFAGVRKDIAGMDDNEREVLTELLLLMDKYDLYGKLALPKKHDPETEIPGLYRLAASSRGVFINPALVENFGITIIEAASSGLPVVSTNHGGPQDIIKNCDCGILIDVRHPEEIGAALKKILVNEDLWRTYSNNGVIGVRKHYAWKAHVEKYLREVQEILEA